MTKATLERALGLWQQSTSTGAATPWSSINYHFLSPTSLPTYLNNAVGPAIGGGNYEEVTYSGSSPYLNIKKSDIRSVGGIERNLISLVAGQISSVVSTSVSLSSTPSDINIGRLNVNLSRNGSPIGGFASFLTHSNLDMRGDFWLPLDGQLTSGSTGTASMNERGITVHEFMHSIGIWHPFDDVVFSNPSDPNFETATYTPRTGSTYDLANENSHKFTVSSYRKHYSITVTAITITVTGALSL